MAERPEQVVEPGRDGQMDLVAWQALAKFEVVVADTPELREAAFALRHDVYCRELESIGLPFELVVAAPPMPSTAVGEISRFAVPAAHRGGLAMVALAFTAVVAADHAGVTTTANVLCTPSAHNGLSPSYSRSTASGCRPSGVTSHRARAAHR